MNELTRVPPLEPAVPLRPFDKRAWGCAFMLCAPIAMAWWVGAIVWLVGRYAPPGVNSEWSYLFVIAPGVTQVVHGVPLLLWAQRTEQWRLRHGLVLGALMVLVLNASCVGLYALGGGRFR